MATPEGKNIFESYIKGDKQAIEQIRQRVKNRNQRIRDINKEKFMVYSNILAEDNPPAVEIYDFLNKNFGDDWWDEWEIETVFDMIQKKFDTDEPNERVRDKILALRHLCRSNAAFDDWYEFCQLSQSFVGAIADFETLRFPSPGAAVCCMMVMNYVRPDMKDQGFGPETSKFVAMLMINNGLYTPPVSVIQHVSGPMKEMVSGELQKMWPAIYRHYKQQIFDKISIESIQANRMYGIEQAARNYYFNDITKGQW